MLYHRNSHLSKNEVEWKPRSPGEQTEVRYGKQVDEYLRNGATRMQSLNSSKELLCPGTGKLHYLSGTICY